MDETAEDEAVEDGVEEVDAAELGAGALNLRGRVGFLMCAMVSRVSKQQNEFNSDGTPFYIQPYWWE